MQILCLKSGKQTGGVARSMGPKKRIVGKIGGGAGT